MIVKIDTEEKAIYIEDGTTYGDFRKAIPPNFLGEQLKIRFLPPEKPDAPILPIPVYIPYYPITNPQYFPGTVDPFVVTSHSNNGTCTVSWDPNLSKTPEKE